VLEYKLVWVGAMQLERGEGGEMSWKGGKVMPINKDAIAKVQKIYSTQKVSYM